MGSGRHPSDVKGKLCLRRELLLLPQRNVGSTLPDS